MWKEEVLHKLDSHLRREGARLYKSIINEYLLEG